VIATLKGLGAEILPVPSGMGYSSGMFWRFMVAVDSTVDRYIVRDVDSRLNARDRYVTTMLKLRLNLSMKFKCVESFCIHIYSALSSTQINDAIITISSSFYFLVKSLLDLFSIPLRSDTNISFVRF
jgi:hypothetical protein